MSEADDIFEDIVDTVTDPQVIVTAVVIYFTAGAMSGPAGAGFQAGAGLTAAGTFVATTAASRALAPDLPALGAFNADTLNSRGRTVQFKSPVAARQIVYGQSRVSGPILWIDTKAGTNNNTLQMIIAINGRESQQILKHYAGDDVVRTYTTQSSQDANQWSVAGNNAFGDRDLNAESTSDFHDYMKVQIHNGGASAWSYSSSTQTWTEYPKPQLANFNFQQTATIGGTTIYAQDWRYKNITYAYIEMDYDATVYKNGVPAHTFELKGCQVYDPRNDTKQWSANPALVIRDYLTNRDYGLNVDESNIDDTSFIAAANVCEEQVGGENRYEINGVVDTSRAPKAILEDMLTACVGTLIFTGGKYRLLVGDYQTPTKTITKDMILSNIDISTKNPARSQVNAVKGVFRDKDQDYLTTDFTPITESVYFFEDDGEPNFIDLTLPFTTSKTMAERIAEITLRQVRNEKQISMTLSLEGFDIDVGDTVYFSDERLGFDQATFQCIGWEMTQDGKAPRINIALRETTPSLFDTTVEIPPISRNAKDASSFVTWFNHNKDGGVWEDIYQVSKVDLSTVFGSTWTQDVTKEYLIPEDVYVVGGRDSTANSLWASTTSPQTYSLGGEVGYPIVPAITIPATLKGKLIIRNRGYIYNIGGSGGYDRGSGGVLINQSPVGEDGGDCFHWLTTSADNQPSGGGTVLIVNDGIIGAGGGGGRAKNISGYGFCSGGQGKDGLNNDNHTGSGETTGGELLVDSFYFDNGTVAYWVIGGYGGDAGEDGDPWYTDADKVSPWTSSGQTQDNAGEIVRVASSPFDLTSTTFDTSAYVQDADGNSRIKINNRGIIRGPLHDSMASLTDVYVD